MPIMYVYPDGTTSAKEPADGTVFYFYDKNQSVIGIYQYDGFLGSWYDITNGTPTRSTLDDGMVNTALDISKPLMKCECGAEKSGSNRHSTWCKKFTRY